MCAVFLGLPCRSPLCVGPVYNLLWTLLTCFAPLSIFDLRAGKLRETLASAHKRGVRALALDPHTRWFASGSAHGDIKVGVYSGVGSWV